MSGEITRIDDFYMFKCPHCLISIIVMNNEINCKIFRCGVMKQTGQQVPSHATLQQCDKLSTEHVIYGCGKPFHFDGKTVTTCDYQ